MFFDVKLGVRCAYDETLVVSGAGVFTFCYEKPYLYVVDEGTSSNSVLKIYDLRNPLEPVLKSTTSLPSGSGAREPRMFGGLLYIPYRVSRYLGIWNVDDPSAPTMLSETSLPDSSPSGPTSVAVIDNIACVTYGFGFTMTTTMQKLNVSDPSSPLIVGSLRPYNPAIVSSGWSVIANNGDFVVCGQVTGGSSVPYIVTVEPVAFVVKDIITIGPVGGGPSQIVDDEVDGDYVYMYNGNNGTMHTIDISNHNNLSEPSAAVSLSTGSGAQHALVSCPDVNRLYMGKAGGSGLQIYKLDITTRSAPVSVGAHSTSGETVTCMRRLDGCVGFAWGQGSGAAIHLMGEPPL